jgi:hypothetical protein
VIEELKRRVPIWKREVFADGSVEWVGAGGEAGKMVGGEEGKQGSHTGDEIGAGLVSEDSGAIL